MFESSTEPLRQLSPTDYKISDANPYCVILTANMSLNPVVSIYYQHQLNFMYWTFPMKSGLWKKNKETGQLERTRLPIQAVARRTHLIVSENLILMDRELFLNDNIQMKISE